MLYCIDTWHNPQTLGFSPDMRSIQLDSSKDLIAMGLVAMQNPFFFNDGQNLSVLTRERELIPVSALLISGVSIHALGCEHGAAMASSSSCLRYMGVLIRNYKYVMIGYGRLDKYVGPMYKRQAMHTFS